jgi:hypothetical protein
MAAKRADPGSRIISAVAGMAASFAVRKLLTLGWTRLTGRKPPESPEDPQVALGEALAWGVLMGAGAAAARLLVTRAVAHRVAGPALESDPEE